MLKVEDFAGQGHGGEDCNNLSVICGSCHMAACTVFCRTESAYLCGECDFRIHGMGSSHERVWMCEACGRAPSAFLCKADAASLCAACDWDIHSANPLARRHHRVPVLPIHDIIGLGIAGSKMGLVKDEFMTQKTDETVDEEDEDEEEAASWLLPNPVKTCDIYGEETDDYLDIDDYDSSINSLFIDHQQHFLVPQKSTDSEPDCCFLTGLKHKAMNTEYNCEASMSQTVTPSELDVGIVPDSNIRQAPLISHSRTPKGTIDLFSSPPIQIPTQLTPIDREARVLRYKEKKKLRKFEKTIRYASRKAYAETRPRIKGRFAKRKNSEIEVDRICSASMSFQTSYGIVPSF